MPGDWFENTGLGGGTFPYCYFRVSAPKHLDFEERAGERERREPSAWLKGQSKKK